MQLIAPSLSEKHRLKFRVSPGDRIHRGSAGVLLITVGDPTMWQPAQSTPIALRPRSLRS